MKPRSPGAYRPAPGARATLVHRRTARFPPDHRPFFRMTPASFPRVAVCFPPHARVDSHGTSAIGAKVSFSLSVLRTGLHALVFFSIQEYN